MRAPVEAFVKQGCELPTTNDDAAAGAAPKNRADRCGSGDRKSNRMIR
jgi:hypothetical protein